MRPASEATYNTPLLRVASNLGLVCEQVPPNGWTKRVDYTTTEICWVQCESPTKAPRVEHFRN